MKNLFFSAIIFVTAFFSNAQIVTINVFETSELRGFSENQSVSELIQDTQFAFVVDTIPYSFTYELDFNTKTCLLKDGNGAIVGKAQFIVKSKYSNRDFQIEFIPTEPGSASGIVVTPTSSAYYIDDTMLIYCTIFKTSYIF
jgi:hypothetical protein